MLRMNAVPANWPEIAAMFTANEMRLIRKHGLTALFMAAITTIIWAGWLTPLFG